MDTWSVKCQSCGLEYRVSASSEEEAIKKAKIEHERANTEALQHRCDFGPLMNNAFNLTHPDHPCAPKE